MASNDGPDTVRLAAGTYAGPSGSVSIDEWPLTSDPITVVGAGETETILAGSGVAENVEAVVRLGSTTDETAPGRLTLRDLTVSIAAAADVDTNAIVTRVQRLALDHVRIRMGKTGATSERHGIWARQYDSELVLDHVDIRPTEASYQPDTGNGVFAFGPLTVRDSRLQVDNLGSNGRVVPIHARNDFVLQRSRLEGGTLGLRFQQELGNPPIEGLVDSSTLRGAAVGILFAPEGSASLALRNSEIQNAYSLVQRISIGTTGGFGSGPITIDSSVLHDPTEVSGMPVDVHLLARQRGGVALPRRLQRPRQRLGHRPRQSRPADRAGVEHRPRGRAARGRLPHHDAAPRHRADRARGREPMPLGDARARAGPRAGRDHRDARRRLTTGPPPGAASAPRLLKLALAAKRFRAKRGTRVRFTLSRAARVQVVVYRMAGKRRITVARLSLAGAAGRNDRALRLKRLKRFKRGAHRIAFTPVSADGARGATRIVKVRLR